MVRDKMPIEGTVITTDSQLEGRGQRSNRWLSEPGLNLTCSYVLRPAFLAAKDQFLLSACVALAVFDVVSNQVPNNPVSIKWPNDVLVGEKKIAGILIENSLRGSKLDHSIVGVGLNVNQSDFPEGIRATSFRSLLQKELEIEQILNELNSALEKRYLQLRQDHQRAILQEFNKHLFAFEQSRILTVNDQTDKFIVRGVRPSGELQLEHADGKNTLHQHHEIEWNLT